MMESSLECEVCFINYDNNEHRPKSLPCGHTICSHCIKDNLKAREGKMDCPFCRTPCGTGIKTLDDFPTTFALLNLLHTGEQKNPSKTLSLRERERETLQQKKRAEYDRTGAHILKCNEHLVKLIEVKESQESAIQSIILGKRKLLEDYDRELKKLEEGEEKATSIKYQVDDIVAEGTDIVKGLEALQDRVQSANSLPGFNMASQDVQRYYTASQEWVTSKVRSYLKVDTHLTRESLESSYTVESLKDMVNNSTVMVWSTIEMKNVIYSAQITITNRHLLLKSLSKRSPPANTVVIPYHKVKGLVDRDNITTFMELSQGNGWLSSSKFIHVKLLGHEGRTQQFEMMCTGEVDGISYVNTTFLDFDGPHYPGIWGGARNDGRDTALPGFTTGNFVHRNIVSGLVAGYFHRTPIRKPTHFIVYTNTQDYVCLEDCSIGNIVFGLNDFLAFYQRAGLHQSGASCIKIIDSGIVLD